MIKLVINSGLHSLQDFNDADKQTIRDAAANRIRDLLQRHFSSKGGRRFWQEAADSVQTELTKDGTNINIYKRGVALRLFGGVVKPTGRKSEMTGKAIKNIFIPGPRTQMRQDGGELIDEVHDPEQVFVLKNKAGRVFLAENRGGEKPYFLGRLVKQTVHKPDESVLPKGDEMVASARMAARNAIKILGLKLK